jgi:putative cardiolipin synthase
MMQQAQEEILAAYYIFGGDSTGRGALYLLREAARRGVKVRLIVDALGNRIPKRLIGHLVREGVEVRLYHKKSFFRPLWLTRRMHDKMLITDGRHLVAGGRNIEEHYFGRSEGLNYIDLDIFVAGESAAEAREYFLALWDSRHVAPPGKKKFLDRKLERARQELDAVEDGLEDAQVRFGTGTDWEARGRQVERTDFFFDPVARARKRKHRGIRADLAELLDRVEESITIEMSYLVVTKSLVRELKRARERGTQVRILTNSLKISDSVWVQAGYVGKRDKLVKLGAELWEYEGPRTIHTKAAVFDDRYTLIGSYNMDPRSRRLNTETAVVVDDPLIAAETRENMDRNLENAWRIGPDGRPEGFDERYPGASRGKKCKVRMIRLILPLIKPQL